MGKGIIVKEKNPHRLFRYQLEKYAGTKTRHKCPSCGKKEFTRYVDIETGAYVGDNFGRCNREHSCGYILTPSANNMNGDPFIEPSQALPKFIPNESGDYSLIPQKLVLQSLTTGKDELSKFLLSTKYKNNYYKAALLYRLGTGEIWNRSTVFWQIDKDGEVRTGKEMLYERSGKRKKEPFPHISWVHSKNFEDYNLKQCLFGEHLINFDQNVYHIVESEKTALVAFMADPTKLWLATGGLNNLTVEKLRPFTGKKLILYPDKGQAYNKWVEKVKDNNLEADFDIKVSDWLEKKKGIKEGEDLADYLLNNK